MERSVFLYFAKDQDTHLPRRALKWGGTMGCPASGGGGLHCNALQGGHERGVLDGDCRQFLPGATKQKWV
jgi:hypothetical protein